MKYIRIITILTVMLLSFNVNVEAQSDPPPFDDNTQDMVPLDGGLSLLLAAGIAYGSKKMYDAKKSDY